MAQVVDIESLATRVYQIMRLSIPVDIEKAVMLLGGEIRCDPNLEAEAKITKEGGRFAITLKMEKKGELNGRDRFSIAHELGHLFLHMGYLNKDERWENMDTYVDSVFFRSFAYTTEELEANQFAAALLMPYAEFIETVEKYQSESGSNTLRVDEIANHFNVTKQAAIIRAKQLKLILSR